MDADRFDDALRRFSTSRRPLARLLLGGLLGGVGLDAANAGNNRRRQRRKKRKEKEEEKPADPVPECTIDSDCAAGLDCSGGQCLCRLGGRCDGCCITEKICRPLRETENVACGINGQNCIGCDLGLYCTRGPNVCQPERNACAIPCDETGECLPIACTDTLYCCRGDITATCNVPEFLCNCIIEGGYCVRS